MQKKQIEDLLSEFTIFQELNEHEINNIVEISISRKWKKGSFVFLQGDPLENVYFIYEGKIKIYKTDTGGKEQIVSLLKKGEMFPHIGFFRKGGYPACAEVVENAVLVVVPIKSFEKVLIENPELCIKMFRVLGDKLVEFQERLESQILHNTYQQILQLLVHLGKTHGIELKDGLILLRSEFTNRDLANMIGTTRETVSRTLTKLKKERLIETDGENNFIFDPAILSEEIFS